MAYVKTTPANFLAKLEAGEYETAGSARKSVGRSKFNDAGAKKCNAAIDAKFGTDAPATKEKSAKAAPKNKKVSVKAVSAKAVKADKTPKMSKNGKKLGRRPNAEKSVVGVPAELFSNVSEALNEIRLAELRVGTITQAIKAMQMVKDEFEPGVKLERAQAAVDALGDIIDGIHCSVISQQETSSPTAGSNGVGGYQATASGTSDGVGSDTVQS